MLLSIGMIVKNEEDKYLRECLSSFKPLLEQVHSELIIYDTGSTDNTVEICREFTPHVFQIEWRSDFAWARNHTVDRARGKWYMFIDADEVFEDVSGIVNFFNNGEYTKYASASYRWKNLHARGQVTYFRPVRLYKMGKDMRFKGKIHEQMPAKTPIKHIESIAAHYGYLYEGETAEADKQKKHERNLAPMLEEFEENPKNGRNISHIINAYLSVPDDKKVKEFIQYGIDAVGDNPDDMYYHVFIYRLIKNIIQDSDFEKAVEEIDKYFNKTTSRFENAPELLFDKGNALTALKKYAEAITVFKEALDMYKKYADGQLDNRLSTILSFALFTPEKESAIAYFISNNYAALHDFDSAIKWSMKLPDPGRIYDVWVQKEIKEKNAAFLTALYKYALQKQPIALDIYDNIIYAIETHGLGEANILMTADAVLAAGDESDYTRLMSLRKAYFNNEPVNEAAYFLDSDKRFSQTFGDVILIAMDEKLCFRSFLDALVVTDSSKLITKLSKYSKNVANILFEYITGNDMIDVPVKHLRILSSLAMTVYAQLEANYNIIKIVAAKTGNEEGLVNIYDIDPGEAEQRFMMSFFERAVRLQHRYLSCLYQTSVYNVDNIQTLSESDAAVLFMHHAFLCNDNGDILGYAQNIRRAVHVKPSLNGILTHFSDALDVYLDEEQPSEADESQQLAAEIIKLKEAICALNIAGDRDKAAQLLDSYQAVNPADPEIIKIKTAINEGVHYIIRKPLKLFWWRMNYPAQLNFGDEITPYLIERILGIKCEWTPFSQCELMGTGSILCEGRHMYSSAAVWGSGFIKDGESIRAAQHHFLAVRGESTRSRIKGIGDIPLGDPGILSNLAFSPGIKIGKIGIVPHYRDFNLPEVQKLKNNQLFMLINPHDQPSKVIAEINSCKLVLSSSLHGLICADSFNIPNYRITLSGNTLGGDYKFNDYCSGVDKELQKFNFKDINSIDVDALTAGYQPIPDLEAKQKKLIAALSDWWEGKK